MKTAIVTGISGQDGAYLARLLLDRVYRVVGVVRPGRLLPPTGLGFLGIDGRVEIRSVDLIDRDEQTSRAWRAAPAG